MDILIKDVADVIVRASDGLTDDVPDDIKQIVQDEVIRITIDDTRDRGLLYMIASIMDEIEKEYSQQKSKGNVKLHRLLEEITKRCFITQDGVTFTQKVMRIAAKLKEVYNDVK